MSKVTAEVRLSIDSKAAQNMLCCAGYSDKKRSDCELVKDLLSILEDYGVTSTVVSVNSLEESVSYYGLNDDGVLEAVITLSDGSKKYLICSKKDLTGQCPLSEAQQLDYPNNSSNLLKINEFIQV